MSYTSCVITGARPDELRIWKIASCSDPSTCSTLLSTTVHAAESHIESHQFDRSNWLFEADGQVTAVRLKRPVCSTTPVSPEIRLEWRIAVCPTPLAVRAFHIDRGASIEAIIYKPISTYDPQVETTAYARTFIPDRPCSPRDPSRLPCYARAAIELSQDRHLAYTHYPALPGLSTSSTSQTWDTFTRNRVRRSA